ncbi:MAG: 50S ribosomal protein L21 [Myxococcota bacterium]
MSQQNNETYAIIEVGGQQQRVCQGDDLLVPFVSDAQQGQQVTWDRVLLTGGASVQVGSPYVKGCAVQATVVQEEIKGSKVRVFKKKRRKGYHKTIGHRQKYTKMRVDAINVA